MNPTKAAASHNQQKNIKQTNPGEEEKAVGRLHQRKQRHFCNYFLDVRVTK